ncbi:MAG: DUF3572 domain-containing protein [Pseudomonadota bacterium]
MGKDEAEALALQALGWMASQDDLLSVFMGSAGVSADELTARAGDPDLLAAVLDFLVMDDAWVEEFAKTTGQDPNAAMRARAALPGGDVPNWT